MISAAVLFVLWIQTGTHVWNFNQNIKIESILHVVTAKLFEFLIIFSKRASNVFHCILINVSILGEQKCVVPVCRSVQNDFDFMFTFYYVNTFLIF